MKYIITDADDGMSWTWPDLSIQSVCGGIRPYFRMLPEERGAFLAMQKAGKAIGEVRVNGRTRVLRIEE